MIFVTVGNMDPFDRLIKAVDDWASANPSDEKIIAQVGDGQYVPANFEYVRRLSPDDFRKRFQEARLVVSHAGMGTIITALELGKPIIIMPKKAGLGEQRNDHQLATVRHFRRSKLIMVADSEMELPSVLNRWNSGSMGTPELATENLEKDAWLPDETLIEYVRYFVQGQPQSESDSVDCA